MQKRFENLKPILRRAIVTLVLCVWMVLSWAGFTNTASLAATMTSNSISSEEQTERAYDGFGEDTGIREEVYQQRLDEGQDPEKMPKPYKRVKDLSGKEVPETSFVEKSVSNVRELVDRVKGE